MTNETKNAKKLYKVFANNHGDEPQGTVTKLNISVDTNRVDVFMNVNRKTLTAAYKVFIKAIEQAVADGALDKKVAEFAYFADDIDFAGKDSIEYYDNIGNSFAFGIDDNTDVDNGFYFWFWTKAEDKSELEQTEINSVEAKEETAMTITTKIAKNGVKMYYLDGKRISRDKAEDIMVNEDDAIIRNANFDTLENFEDAQAVLDIEVVNPIGINELKGWYLSFKTVADAINAASKVPALFGDRFSKAYVMGNAPYHNKVLATVDAAGTVEVNTDEIADVAPAGNAEIHNAQVASGNYSVDINGERVTFENHSIVWIDAMRKLNMTYDHTGKNKIFRHGKRKSSAAKVIKLYMNRERAEEQGKYFHEFFDKYNKASGTIEVWVSLTYADGVDHHFMAEFNQGRLAQKFIADVEKLAGDTPCQTFIKYRDNHVKPVWEDPHNFDIVGNLETVRQINYGEETADVNAALEGLSGTLEPVIIDNGKTYTEAEYAAKAKADKSDTPPFSTKTDKNGRLLYYIDGKRASHDKAIEACAKMRGDNHFTIEYTNQYWQDGEVISRVDRKTMSRLDVKIGMHEDGWSVYFYNGQATIHTFTELEDAVDCVNQIESAYIAGAAGVKVDVAGKVNVDNDISWQMRQVCNDRIHTFDGEWQYIESLTYDAALYKKAYGGHLTWCVDDKDVSEQDFWRAMQQRGACTVDNPLTVANMLTAKLKEATREASFMGLCTQDGRDITRNIRRVEVHVDGAGFTFARKDETLARYDNAEQCLYVIDWLKRTIEDGDDEFDFPTAEFVDLEKKAYASVLKEFDDYRYIGKGRWLLHGRRANKLLTAQLKYFGLSLAELKEAHHAV